MKKHIVCFVIFGQLAGLFGFLLKHSFEGIPNVFNPSYETICSVVYGASVILFLLFSALFLETIFYFIKFLGGKKNDVVN